MERRMLGVGRSYFDALITSLQPGLKKQWQKRDAYQLFFTRLARLCLFPFCFAKKDRTSQRGKNDNNQMVVDQAICRYISDVLS